MIPIHPDLINVKDLGCFLPSFLSLFLTRRVYHTDILMSVKQRRLSHLHPGGSPRHTDCKFLSISVCLFFTYQSVSQTQVTFDFPHVLACKYCSVFVLSDTGRDTQCYQRHRDKQDISCLCFLMWAFVSEPQCMLSCIPNIRLDDSLSWHVCSSKAKTNSLQIQHANISS